jgi:hypothetical protein
MEGEHLKVLDEVLDCRPPEEVGAVLYVSGYLVCGSIHCHLQRQIKPAIALPFFLLQIFLAQEG